MTTMMQHARRNFVSRTIPKRSGDGPHLVWNTKKKRFSVATSLAVLGGGVTLGVGIPVFAIKFQNKKHGFSK
jgi:hypothetical protein